MKKELQFQVEESRILSDLLSSSEQPFAVGGIDGSLKRVNPAYCKLTGYTEKELIEQKDVWNKKLTPEKWRKMEAQQIARMMKTKKPVRFEKEILTKNGIKVPIELFAQPKYNNKGELESIFAFVTDITERKKIKHKLIKSKAQIHKLLISSSAVIYSSKPSGDFPATFMSENVKGLTGFESSDFIGDSKFWINHIHPEDISRLNEEMQKLFKKKQHTYEYRFKCKNGTYKWIKDDMVLQIDKKGEPKEITGYLADITERKKALEEINDLAKFPSENPNPVLRNKKDGTLLYSNHNGK